MGHETGIFIEHGEPCGFQTTYSSSTPDFNTITFTGTASGTSSIFQGDPILKVPVGMLIGQKISFHKVSGGTGTYTSVHSDGFSQKVFTIVDHTVESNVTKLKIVPRFTTSTLASSTGDAMLIHSTGMPTLASGSTFAHNDSAALSSEFSQIDQFIGLASHMKLPDTKVTMHRHHVIGLGRQAAIQQTGRVFHQGAQLEMPLNNPRWLYYSLGREVIDAHTSVGHLTGADPALDHSGSIKSGTKVTVGQTYVDVTSTTFNDITIAIGDYVLIRDTTRVPVIGYDAPDTGASDDKFWPPASTSTLTSDSEHFEETETSEFRRVVAIETITGGARLFVDDPFQFEHISTDSIFGFRFNGTTLTGSPHVNSDGTITNPTRRLLFSGDTLPSFCIEHSIRNRDVGSHSNENDNAPGSSTDSKQLTRVFRGCKIVEYELNATVDAEVKYRCIFDALSCYTDTGRLESSNPGDRYRAHRLFQNTATDAAGRKEAGIASGSEKPFMFYNGTITAFGQDIGFISTFELRGKTGVEIFHTMGGTPVAESVTTDGTNRSLKQVPYGGTRNASIIREGREEFELEMDVIIRDSLLFHELRTHREVSGTAGSTDSIIEMVFTKPSTGSTGSQQQMRIICDDYVITDAPIPVPDDKGLLHSKIMIHPKNIKVISTDTLFHC
jgi:hypothetical protein